MNVYVNEEELKAAYIGHPAFIDVPGIYHSPDLGLISLSSDGTTWITIADKNLGATQVYNDGDTLSEANCGKFYQWGNSYGFPYSGATSSGTSTVNASTYGPGNYYNSNVFIKASNGIWDSSNNTNLWGGVTGTNEAMKGPCNSGYHIPSSSELTNLMNVGVSLGAWATSGGANMKIYIKFPFSGGLTSTGGALNGGGSFGYMRSSNKSGSGTAYALISSGGTVQVISTPAATNGFSIRPFANTPIQPDDSWTKLY